MNSRYKFIRQPEAIEARSFEIIREGLVEQGFQIPDDPATWEVIRRVVHSTADFEFARNLRFHPQATVAIITALQQGCPVITDARMVQAGLKNRFLQKLGVRTHCYIDDPEARQLARSENITVSMAAMRLAARNHTGQHPLFAIGNAPTALFELLDLAKQGLVAPSAIIGIPVGFVAVPESKEALLQVAEIPWITSVGCKGGSAATAAALNALILRAAGS